MADTVKTSVYSVRQLDSLGHGSWQKSKLEDDFDAKRIDTGYPPTHWMVASVFTS